MIRKLKIEDAQPMLECILDENVNKYMKIDGRNQSISSCIKFIVDSWFEKSNIHYAIVDDADTWVGTISLKNVNLENLSAELAIISSTRVHGSGIAYEATKEILNFAFNQFGLKRVYLNVVSDNIRANKFYQKCGFVLEGTFHQAIFIKGKVYDLNWYAIIKK